jgi:signal transduction histidine kinase
MRIYLKLLVTFFFFTVLPFLCAFYFLGNAALKNIEHQILNNLQAVVTLKANIIEHFFIDHPDMIKSVPELVQDNIGLGESGETLLVAREANKKIVFLTPLRFPVAGADSNSVTIGDNRALAAQAAAQGGNGIGYNIDYRGKEVLSVWRYLPKAGCGIVAKVDKDEALASFFYLQRIVVLSFIIAFIIAFVVAILLARSIARPINQLKIGAKIVGSGNLDHHLAIASKDEIGELSREFDAMTQSLKNTMASREQLQQAYDVLKNAESQLMQASKMSAVGQVAGGIAHEINNPLFIVVCNVQMARKLIESGEQCDYKSLGEMLALADEASVRCSHIVKALLNFARAPKMDFVPVSINDALDNVLLLCREEFYLARIKLDISYASDIPWVNGNAQLLQQVFYGLLQNAKWAASKKYPESGGEVKVIVCYDSTEKLVKVAIEDNGIGVAPNDMGKIFEPFFTTKPAGEGTGLGLPLAKSIVEKHKGSILFHSRFGEGSVFTVILPINS